MPNVIVLEPLRCGSPAWISNHIIDRFFNPQKLLILRSHRCCQKPQKQAPGTKSVHWQFVELPSLVESVDIVRLIVQKHRKPIRNGFLCEISEKRESKLRPRFEWCAMLGSFSSPGAKQIQPDTPGTRIQILKLTRQNDA